jgi:hypothetical protein
VKRVIKVLTVAVLVVTMLVVGISPAMARRVSGGVLLRPTSEFGVPCDANTVNAQNQFGTHLRNDPPGRAPGCWVLLPPSATQND